MNAIQYFLVTNQIKTGSGGGGGVLFPGPPPDFSTWFVIGVAFDDFGVPQDGVTIRATALSGVPTSFDGVRFETDGQTEATAGQALTYRNAQGMIVEHPNAPATPGTAWLLLPPGVTFRFDSVGAYIPRIRGEAIQNQRLTPTKSGSLYELLKTPVAILNDTSTVGG